jgi:nucleoside-diphosphate-sugar epimerase
MGNPQNARDFSDVRDVSEIYARLIDVTLDERYTIVNMTSGKVHTLREIITVCEALTDHMIKVEVDPRFVRKNDPLVIKASTDVLSNLIGTIPSRPLEDTLSWMLGDNVQPQETGVKTPAVDR